MWHKVVGIIVIGMLISGWSIDRYVAQSSTSSSERALVQAQVADITADGRASDMVKVIVTLRQPSFARTVGVDPLNIQQRSQAVRLLQQDFVGNELYWEGKLKDGTRFCSKKSSRTTSKEPSMSDFFPLEPPEGFSISALKPLDKCNFRLFLPRLLLSQ
jgi:hypothetical protein